MPVLDSKVTELEARLDQLVRTQIDFQTEINTIRMELTRLRRAATPDPGAVLTTSSLNDTPAAEISEGFAAPQYQQQTSMESSSSPTPPDFDERTKEPRSESTTSRGNPFSNYFSSYVDTARTDLEKFIGENLISLIGTIILILGVGIGAKYAIDNGWISPLMRIVFGYAMGFGLLGVAVRLKAKYHNFSAVLLSGGMSIMYFITYFGYAYYSLMPQSAAFVLMAIFTAFTVASAIIYDRQVIAHIGLVGGYAVPFLLSDGSGNYLFLFTYMAILNAGILAISVTRYWRPIFYTAFAFTWLIFGSWFLDRYQQSEHFVLGAVFASIFFAIFYAVSFAYRLVNNNIGATENAGQVFANSFIYYGVGYAILDSRENLQQFEGLFTGAHALLHSAVAQFVSRFRSNAVDVVQVLAVLIITFTTISIPVQFDGNYVTLIWTVEGAALFWFGRARLIPLFEYFSYPIMALATLSLSIDWITAYGDRTMYVSEFNRQPLANGDLVTALVFVAAFAFIYITNKGEQAEPVLGVGFVRPFGILIGTIGLFVLYNAFRIEISIYYHVQTAAMAGHMDDAIFVGSSGRIDPDLSRFNALWQINYTLVFLTVLGFVNLRKLRSGILAAANIFLGLVALFVFLTVSMTLFYELRVNYMSVDAVAVGTMNIAIRYISYALAAGLLFLFYKYSQSDLLRSGMSEQVSSIAFDAVLYSSGLIGASCELINLMAQLHIADGNKLGLSILWGVYSLFLIVIGISKHKKHLRIAAIVLLAVTLVKLFLYDVADLPTIPKTILFVSLGLLMLLVSFLYNKYKDVIFGPPVEQEN